ncbi:conserved hypothetical protein [Histoplasma capsulatum var. duboisii H88]|uniref:Restriction of telomere capping protein 4 n=1 Tax=Ajellomyces capsulatus (strain H88) TaxID=544711 RepID=F0UVZ0_AJEC8|nr:conserved hypothetical protein [Histoplasma capsulatum var. duboisii H88]
MSSICRTCVKDDMTMSDTDSLSTHSNSMNDNYCASSKEDDPTELLPKQHRLSTQLFHATPRAAAADHEDIERKDSKLQTMAAKDYSAAPCLWNTDHGPETYSHSRALMLSSAVAQFVFEMVTSCLTTAPGFTDEVLTTADTKRDYSEQTVDDLDEKRCCWMQEEDDHLMALRRVGFSWPEIVGRFPQRRLRSLQQRWYILQKRQAPPATDKRRRKRKCSGSTSEPLPTSKPPKPLETPHPYHSRQLQAADDPATPRTEPSTPSLSSTVTAMCPGRGCVVDMKASSAFSAANTRMRVREQLQFCENHQRETAQHKWSQCHYPSIAWDCLDDRLTQFHPHLHCILDDLRYHSQYKSVLHKKVQKHGRKILSQNVLHGTGYYGLRGHAILSQHVVRHFACDIDTLAGLDSVVSKYSTVVYTQEILVPELLEMLVREDMGVDAERARRILGESNEIGDLLNSE